MIVIDTHKLYYILDHTPINHNIMLVGRHGIGKSEILTDYYQSKGIRVISLFLGQMSDPGDLIGLPLLVEGQTRFAPPEWFPQDDKPIVLFLDELNRARPEILQTVMDLALNRKLANHSLPEGSRIISAINEGEEYQLTNLDPALVSRFNVYQFSPTVQEWMLWAEKKEIDQRVIDFIQQDSSALDGTEEIKIGEDTGLEKYPDRRAWFRVSQMLQETNLKGETKPRTEFNDIDLDLIAGVIGARTASRFFAFIEGRHQLTGLQILNNYPKYESLLRKYKLHQLAIVNEGIYRHFEVNKTLLNDLNEGIQVNNTLRLYSDNLNSYFTLLEELEQRETIAHFVSLFQNGNYDNAVLFISSYCPEIYTKMLSFISSL